jgi:glycosyltransferase involved in cell wall biosynthesis
VRKRVLFIVPYPTHHAPSQRFRVELYEMFMKQDGIDYTIAPFMDVTTWNILYKGGSTFQKALGIVKGYLNRWKTILFDVPRYDYIFVHREAAPMGPPVFEWIIAKLWRKKMIFDFDDAIWIPNTSAENKWIAWFKAFWKTAFICKWSYKVTGGNQFLCSFALQHNPNTILLPTCVDVELYHNTIKEHHTGHVTVGWTGSQSTLFYLDMLLPIIQELQEEINFTFLVIANKDPNLPLKHYNFIPWNEQTEVEDLLQMDIGVMPLEPDAWSEGKCGFKLIQYLSLGIPAVASPIGVNRIIIDDNINGYCAVTKEEWKNHLKLLIKDASLRKRLGIKGREKIVQQYSVQSQRSIFINLFS